MWPHVLKLFFCAKLSTHHLRITSLLNEASNCCLSSFTARLVQLFFLFNNLFCYILLFFFIFGKSFSVMCIPACRARGAGTMLFFFILAAFLVFHAIFSHSTVKPVTPWDWPKVS